MPRLPDIGWQHGKMIGGHRHHVQCNYCHRTMIGGITRFKKHLASKRGEIKGCEAVPKEIRDIIRKHLALGKSKNACEKKSKEATIVSLVGPFSSDKKSESADSDGDQDITTPRQEFLSLHEEEAQSEQRLMVETRKFFDAFSNVSSKDDQGSAPPRATDLGWAHGLMVNGDRQKIQCRYCYKVILGGGISRLKQHLAGERGNIAPCDKVPDDVKGQMQQHLGFKILEKFKKQRESRPVKYYSHQNQEEEINGDIHRNPKVIDHTWEDLCNPLHAASYYLNPSIFYHPSFSSNSIIKKSLLDCIETLEPDSTAQVTITRQIKYYEEAMGDFSRPLALRGRESLPPATWWSLYASNYPELQRFAVRILSQTCSGTRCGKDDSMFERMRSSRKNLIELERLSHLTFVHHNLHLQQRQPAALGSSTLAWGACDPICVEGVNINAREWVEHREGPEHDPHWINVTLHMNDKIHNINDYIISIDHGGTTDNGSNDGENS
ncbi:hypothetical protein QJS10_CPB22g01094 [Acorus calamus]|uniref:BED-type domain-containing protein n=1 Tax=Acorus calamus TaxID=4465 RepID=A0AAV9C0E6_ACOCL|nr:hypothetical protein QJS10_CPB22g01094 [Acorus calamus]